MDDLAKNQRHATKDDIKHEFAICVSGVKIRENQNLSPDEQQQVFMVHRRNRLLAPVMAKKVEIKGGLSMVHNPLTPLPSTGAVAWTESNGPLLLHTEDGIIELNALRLHKAEEAAEEIEEPHQIVERVEEVRSGRTSSSRNIGC